MALTLNTNIDSLNAQNNLTSSQASLSQALERLSSGLRINSAADDAAGLAIAQNLTTQINGSNQAINNANDAVSEAQTAGGALSTIVSNLQSIRTLAVEAANGSNSSSDRAALDQQVQQQIAEITQIASQTTFNGAKILDGSSGVTTYQVGANVGDTIAVDLSQGVRADQIGQVASGNLTVASTSALDGAANGLVISVGNGASVTVGASAATPNAAGTAAAGQTADSAYAKAAAINAAGIAGLTTTASTTVSGVFTTINAATAGTGTPQTAATASTYDLSINGTSIYGGTGNLAVGSSLTAAQVAAQINLYSATDGNVTASVNNNQLVLTASDGQDIALAQTYTAGAAAVVGTGTGSGSTAGTAANAGATQAGISSTIAGAYNAGASTLTNTGQVTLSADSNITIGGSAADLASLGTTAGTLSLSASKTLSAQNVLTVAGANATIAAVDSALQTVSAFDSQLGAIQNRFTAAVSSLTATSQNLTQSRSTLEDADFAAETANLTQAQVLQQAGISVLAQANQEPQLILKLLQ